MKYLAIAFALLFPLTLVAQIKEGVEFKAWPKKQVGFTESDGLQAIVKLFVDLKVKSIDPKKSKVKRPFTNKDFGLKKKLKDEEKTQRNAAAKTILKERGWSGMVLSPSKDLPSPQVKLDKVKTGEGVLTSDTSGGLIETSFASSKRIWMNFTTKKDGKDVKGEFLFFMRGTLELDWTINLDGFRTMVSEDRGLGAQATFNFFKLLKPTDAKAKLYLAYLMGRTFEKTDFPWWEYEVYADKLVGDEAGTMNVFFSHFLIDEPDAVIKRATYVYCFLKKIKTPAKEMLFVEESLLLVEVADKRKKIQADKEYVGFFTPKDIKGSKVKRILKAAYALEGK